ncbi:hypothetical protein [Alteribacter natronophilus]|uniref:hypothetical protein n=1 Tax=Alteribacter natronophilus TaxID=2583810 RepID=UPI00110D839E|nr:hypothetical protein [Alteribacter natronophilus]TMW70331.1 hypothetical protein FGB90_16785 [Alteribacter natronophilus]
MNDDAVIEAGPDGTVPEKSALEDSEERMLIMLMNEELKRADERLVQLKKEIDRLQEERLQWLYGDWEMPQR